MKKTILSLLFSAFVLFSNAQTENLIGSWLMTKAVSTKGMQEPYQITEFKQDGKMMIFDIEFGSWKYDQSTNSLVLKSEYDKDFNGVGKIIKLNEDELVVLKDGVTMYYSKVYPNKIAATNQNSKLEGSWRFQPNDWTTDILKFDLPDSFELIETEDASTTTIRGSWIFNPEENTVIIVSLRNILRGKNRILNLNPTQLELENNGNSFFAIKEEIAENEIERLKFTEDDFYTEEGEYKYDDENQLPWLNNDDLINYLQNIHQLVYKYSTLIEGTGSFLSKTLTADVAANMDEETASIDYIFYGYDRYNLPEDTELPPNSDYSNTLFPLMGDIYRITGTEQITVAAGTFDCKVLEIMGDSELRKKAWMIRDKPGVYAKIIEDKDGSFGKYSVYELQEIK